MILWAKRNCTTVLFSNISSISMTHWHWLYKYNTYKFILQCTVHFLDTAFCFHDYKYLLLTAKCLYAFSYLLKCKHSHSALFHTCDIISTKLMDVRFKTCHSIIEKLKSHLDKEKVNIYDNQDARNIQYVYISFFLYKNVSLFLIP